MVNHSQTMRSGTSYVRASDGAAAGLGSKQPDLPNFDAQVVSEGVSNTVLSLENMVDSGGYVVHLSVQ